MTIHFYAGLRELAQVSNLRLEWRPDMTVSMLRQIITSQLPRATALLERSFVAVNDQMVGNEHAIPDEADVALLPPVSGG